MNLTILVLTTLICIMSIAFYKSYKENKHIGVGTVVFLFFFCVLLSFLISEIQFAFFYEEVEGTTISSRRIATKGRISTYIKYRYKYKGLLYYEEMPKPGYDVKVPNGRYTVRVTNLFHDSRIDFSKPLE